MAVFAACVIGSETKWATFRHCLAARDLTPGELARVTCPIGVPGITRKEPDVISRGGGGAITANFSQPVR